RPLAKKLGESTTTGPKTSPDCPRLQGLANTKKYAQVDDHTHDKEKMQPNKKFNSMKQGYSRCLNPFATAPGELLPPAELAFDRGLSDRSTFGLRIKLTP
uniref:Uncharacterized protein n=1 Tax=Romanomermis culicivorax TaxID=13658 RepID=A0A915HVP0_ROMCU